MITKIQPKLTANYNYFATQNKQISENKFQENYTNNYNSNVFRNYNIPFTSSSEKLSPLDPQEIGYDNVAYNIIAKATELAKSYKHKEVNQWHFIAVSINDTLNFIKDLNNNKKELEERNLGEASTFFSQIYSDSLFENKDYRNKFEQALKQEQQTINKKLKEIPVSKAKKYTTPKLSQEYISDLLNVRESLERDENIINGFDLFNGAFSSNISEVAKHISDFSMKINDLLMLEDTKNDRRLHFSNYDKRAENIMKNLALKTNMFVTYDNDKINPNYFVPSIIKTFNTNNKTALNSKNTEIVEFNKNVDMDYIQDKISLLAKDKNKNHIILFSQNALRDNSLDDDGAFRMPVKYLQLMEKTPDNIRIIVVDSKDHYLNYMQNPAIANAFNDFGEMTVPVLNSDDVLNALLENKEHVNNIKENISKKTLEKIVNISSQMNGNFPDKTLNLLKKISTHYIDKKEITPKDIDKFVKDSDYLFKQADKDSSIEIIFDTGKRLKDIIGKTNTKKEAENIIKQIKNNTIGTKGFIVYSQDGMVGGGRRHTAEVIAGEARVPFVAINTMDFGTEDVNLFGGNAMSPEASIKKIFSLVSTQAEANPHKSAVLFIENFEFFSVGELVSEYHQKAMAQLIREMTNAEKKGLNIVVMGSVSSPSLLGKSAVKSFKFNDNIEISSPAIDENERFEILKYTTKHNKIKLDGNEEQQEKLLQSTAKTLRGFSFIGLKSFIKKAESIAQERNHKAITKEDLIESYLRITTGRPSTGEVLPHEQELVTKHECGHAITLQIMNNLMKKQNKPWLIPDTVNFITLDPRGYYGGAMYNVTDKNHEHSFETNFADIVCCYGGHSSEKKFYDMDGSWGISCDLNQATSTAESMVTAMGQGHYTGKISLANMYEEENFERNITPRLREKIEADVEVITKNALTVSDLIVNTYADFINEFADKYAHLVGTGDCLVDGDTFRQELDDWTQRQTKEKLDEIKVMDNMILDAIKASKNGKIY